MNCCLHPGLRDGSLGSLGSYSDRRRGSRFYPIEHFSAGLRHDSGKVYFDLDRSCVVNCSNLTSICSISTCQFCSSNMRPRPDLSYPGLPDADELPHPHSARKVENGGTSLRDDNFQWPEAGPSESSKAKGLDGAESRRDGLGPFGAKAAAAMTGAVATSLLSE
jgi:hypothetical protein